MNTAVIENKKNAEKSLNDIYEFFALILFPYKILTEEMMKGQDFSINLSQTGIKLDNDGIRKKIESFKDDYLIKLCFQHMVGIFEFWFFETISILLQNPKRINKKKQIDVEMIYKSINLEELKKQIIDNEINELKYKKVADWFKTLNNYINIKSMNNDDIKNISEIKATRDVLVHNNGIVNEIYITKSGSKARNKVGHKIDLTCDYFNNIWSYLKSFIIKCSDEIAKKDRSIL
ncbi:MAG: hypothetical protein KAT05_14255 [Spirochaetes bacterium]|nr:hypothetical protein [Spirochaetota bacterium]